MRLNDDGKTVAAYDLLVPGVGERSSEEAREKRGWTYWTREWKNWVFCEKTTGGILIFVNTAELNMQDTVWA